MKGNSGSMLFHTEESPSYDAVRAEVVVRERGGRARGRLRALGPAPALSRSHEAAEGAHREVRPFRVPGLAARGPLGDHDPMDAGERGRSAPTLFLTVGLPGTGKTTAARQLERQGALRLTKDDWVKALYGTENPAAAQAVIEGRLVEIALRGLELGIDVVVDFGLWSRDERTALRHAAAERGARVVLVHREVDPAEQRRRLDRRQSEAPGASWPMSDEELRDWAAAMETPSPGELDGSDPVGAPPSGFATWDDWRRHRWPPSVP